MTTIQGQTQQTCAKSLIQSHLYIFSSSMSIFSKPSPALQESAKRLTSSELLPCCSRADHQIRLRVVGSLKRARVIDECPECCILQIIQQVMNAGSRCHGGRQKLEWEIQTFICPILQNEMRVIHQRIVLEWVQGVYI